MSRDQESMNCIHHSSSLHPAREYVGSSQPLEQHVRFILLVVGQGDVRVRFAFGIPTSWNIVRPDRTVARVITDCGRQLFSSESQSRSTSGELGGGRRETSQKRYSPSQHKHLASCLDRPFVVHSIISFLSAQPPVAKPLPSCFLRPVLNPSDHHHKTRAQCRRISHSPSSTSSPLAQWQV